MAVKRQLVPVTRLTYPVPHAPTVLSTSEEAVGVVLQQAFFTKCLEPVQRSYTAFDRELPAVYEAVHHFCHFLEDLEFHVLTDHKPLTHAIGEMGDNFTPRGGG